MRSGVFSFMVDKRHFGAGSNRKACEVWAGNSFQWGKKIVKHIRKELNKECFERGLNNEAESQACIKLNETRRLFNLLHLIWP